MPFFPHHAYPHHVLPRQAHVDPKWSGTLHFFQLWINLPGAHKMDKPHFLNAEGAVLPTVTVGLAGVKPCPWVLNSNSLLRIPNSNRRASQLSLILWS